MSVSRKPEQIYDLRMFERYRAKGMFDEKAWKKWLKDLKDTQSNVEYISADLVFGKPGDDNKPKDG